MNMKEKNFEEAMERLRSIVEELERGDLSLEESLKKFEEGVKLSQFCLGKLDEAEKRIEILARGEGGKLVTKEFQPEVGA
ncbi:MAG: exodeoxyribonuclease VII small subunit [Pseudomonadota bacterium]